VVDLRKPLAALRAESMAVWAFATPTIPHDRRSTGLPEMHRDLSRIISRQHIRASDKIGDFFAPRSHFFLVRYRPVAGNRCQRRLDRIPYFPVYEVRAFSCVHQLVEIEILMKTADRDRSPRGSQRLVVVAIIEVRASPPAPLWRRVFDRYGVGHPPQDR
jgi:hypothetical protein